MNAVQRNGVSEELERVKADFRALVYSATAADLRRRSDGTRWTNRQLLFHMLFGYLIVTTLQPLVWAMARAPERISRTFACALQSVTRPFHVVNYLGSLVGGRLLGRAGMTWLLDRVINRLQASLRRRSDAQLARGMHFPVGWDPYFHDYMTVLDVYHYGTQHYAHHRTQLTLAALTTR